MKRDPMDMALVGAAIFASPGINDFVLQVVGVGMIAAACLLWLARGGE